MRKILGLLLIGFVLVLTLGWNSYAQRKTTKVTWEYISVWDREVTSQKLNELGSQGWELVSVTSYGDPNFHSTAAYFKRAK
jgi:hypothetical protein